MSSVYHPFGDVEGEEKIIKFRAAARPLIVQDERQTEQNRIMEPGEGEEQFSDWL